MLPTLYLITDRHCAQKGFLETTEAALKGGVRFVQLREKDLKGRELLELARSLRALSARYGAKLIINDRLDVALLSGADGVHLGSSGIPAASARKLLGKDALIGVSTHSVKEAREAEDDGASFITFGPVYFTPSKARYGEPVGVAELKKAVKEVSIPVYALGGIDKDNLREAVAAGASVSLISAIMGSIDPESSAREILDEIRSASNKY